MDITKDIQPMTTFRNHSAEIMQHLKETGRPVVLTVNGKAAAVIQDAEAYQRLLDLAANASTAEGIRQGLQDAGTGRGRPAREVFDEICEEAATLKGGLLSDGYFRGETEIPPRRRLKTSGAD
jgi:prevent-host-death family protein